MGLCCIRNTAALLLVISALSANAAPGTSDSGHARNDRGRNNNDQQQFNCEAARHSGPAPSIRITSPVEDGRTTADLVLVSGMYSGPDNSGVTVNGIVALTDGRFFYANNVPLQPGENEIRAVLTTPSGKTEDQEVEVHRIGQSKLQFSASSLDGSLAPSKVKFDAAFVGTAPIQSVSIDFNGDGITDFSDTQFGAPLEYTYSNPGIYIAKITVVDGAWAVHESTFAVQVLDPTTLDRKFNAIFSDMNTALACGQTDRALLHVSREARERYAPVFRALRSRLGDIVRSYSPLQRSAISAGFSEYAVNRTINGVDRLFLIYFTVDEDGVWRIDSM